MTAIKAVEIGPLNDLAHAERAASILRRCLAAYRVSVHVMQKEGYKHPDLLLTHPDGVALHAVLRSLLYHIDSYGLEADR